MGIYLSNLSGGLIQGNITHDNSAHGIYLTGSTTGVTVQGNTSYHNAYQYDAMPTASMTSRRATPSPAM